MNASALNFNFIPRGIWNKKNLPQLLLISMNYVNFFSSIQSSVYIPTFFSRNSFPRGLTYVVGHTKWCSHDFIGLQDPFLALQNMLGYFTLNLQWYLLVCKSVHHHTFHINQPTRCNNFSSLLLDVYSYVQLNMFRPSSRPSSGAHQLQ